MPDRMHGAGLFADVSGFTGLTESLASELGPQRGVELLTATLNRVFHDVIAAIDRYGGQVIYFSGDAITCFFDEDDGTRATAAALAVQQTMAGLDRVTTPGGAEIRLAIKVVVAVGPARRFVVGDPTIQLIDVLAGTIVDELALTETLAEAGEVLLAPSAVAALGSRVGVTALRPTRTSPANDRTDEHTWSAVVESLAVEVAERPETPEPELPEAEVRPWLLPVVYERLSTGRGEFLAELRSAHPMFVRFGGIDFDHDPEAPAKLDDFVRLTQRVLSGHGGNVLQLTLGDKGAYLYAVFGSPNAHSDDAVRAAAAALELRAAAVTTAAQGLQIGITHGRLRSGTYGHHRRRTFTCLGDAVNLAARLMTQAPLGGVHVSEEVRRAAADRFAWRAVGPVIVKGRNEPVEVWSLEGAAEGPYHVGSRDELPIVGRQRELANIVAAAHRAASGHGSVVAVRAEAGRGKSRLVAEVVRVLRETSTVVLGEPSVIDRNGSYVIWRDVWRALLGIDAEADETAQRHAAETALMSLGPDQVRRLPLLAPVLGLDLPDNDVTRAFDAKLRKSSLEALLVDLLGSIAARRPVTVVLEDCDRIDPLSRDLLEVLVRVTRTVSVLFLATYRPTGEPGGGLGLESLPQFTEFVLAELDDDDADVVLMRKLRQLFGADVQPSGELVALVRDRSQGNPFYLEELISYIHSRGIDPTDPSQVRGLDLPGSMHNLVLGRIDTLTEAPRRTVKVASVLGQTFSHVVVQQAYPELGSTDQTYAYLVAARSADLVSEDPLAAQWWRFRHVIVREVAYQSLPFALRERLHTQVALLLEAGDGEPTGPELDLLAHHWWHSGDRAKQIEYLRRAGEAAQARYANAAAIDYFERLAGLLDGSARADVLLRLGKVLELTGAWDRARTVDDEALALARAAGDQGLAAWCEVSLAEVARKQGRFDEAGERLRRAAIQFASGGDESGRAQVLHLAGTVAAQRGDYAAARANYLNGLELRRRAGDEGAMAAALSNLGVVAEYEGDLGAARSYHEEALALRTSIGDRWAIAVSNTNLGMISLLQQRPGDARFAFEDAMRLNVEVGDTWMVAISHNNLGNAWRDLGDMVVALDHYAAAARPLLTNDDKWALAFLFEDAALCLAQLARPEIAEELLGAADRCRDEVGSPRPEALEADLTARLATAVVASSLDAAGRRTARARGRTFDSAAAGEMLLSMCQIITEA